MKTLAECRSNDGKYKAGTVMKNRETGTLYEILYIVHPMPTFVGDIYAAYRLSAYDGMPIGPRVWIVADDFAMCDGPIPVEE